MRRFAIIGHRGAPDYAPENTMPSFELALTLGANALETDVFRSRDGVLVLIHGASDGRVDHTTDGRGCIAEMAWSELAALDAGAWFNERAHRQGQPERAKPAYVGLRIPRLEDFVDAYSNRVPLDLEIKPRDGSVARAVFDVVAARSQLDRITFTSFDPINLRTIHRAMPTAHVALLTRDLSAHTIEQARGEGMLVYPTSHRLTREVVDMIRATGQEFVRAFDINSDERMTSALECGVDGMTINAPDKLVSALQQSGSS